MKIILLKDIKNLGKKFEIKEVKEGYARNYLLPNKLVIIANKENIKKIKIIQEKIKLKEKKKIELIEKEKEIINNLVLKFKVRVGNNNEVFGSINKNDLKKILIEKGIKNFEINLEKPLKKIGLNEVEINLGKNQKVNLKVELKQL